MASNLQVEREGEKFRRKALRARPCPFCQRRPHFELTTWLERRGEFLARAKVLPCCEHAAGWSEAQLRPRKAVRTVREVAARCLAAWDRYARIVPAKRANEMGQSGTRLPLTLEHF